MSYKYSIPRRLREGEIYTQEELYREYYPTMMKILYTRGRTIMDAEDIAHNIFLYLFEIWDSIKWETIENLISIVMYQRVVRYYQENDKDSNKTNSTDFIELANSSVVNDPFESLLKNDFRKVLQDSFAGLTAAEKTMFFGYYLEGKKIDELRGNKHKGTVFTLLHRSRIKVSDYFAANYPGGLHQ